MASAGLTPSFENETNKVGEHKALVIVICSLSVSSSERHSSNLKELVKDKPKLLIFDLDDTLAPASSNYDLAMLEIGISPNDPFFLKARQKVKEGLPPLAPVARSRFLYLKTYLELNGQYTSARCLELAEKYESSVVEKMATDWFRLGRKGLFDEIRNRGYRSVILSNETCRLQTRKLAAFEGSEQIFERILTSEERGLEKPDPSLFCEMLNLYKLEPQEALMIGDSFKNDIEPCLRLGIPAIQTLEFLKPQKVHTVTIKSLDQVLGLL